MSDPPVHLAEMKICKKEPHTTPYVQVTMQVSQSDLDGMQTLLSFLAGFERASPGQIPGYFNTLMFYRSLSHNIRNANDKAEKDERS